MDHHKIPPGRKSGPGSGLGSWSSQKFGGFLIFLQWLKLACSIMMRRFVYASMLCRVPYSKLKSISTGDLLDDSNNADWLLKCTSPDSMERRLIGGPQYYHFTVSRCCHRISVCSSFVLYLASVYYSFVVKLFSRFFPFLCR